MKFDKNSQAQEKHTRILEQHRKSGLGARLIPFNLENDLGIRAQDCFAFKSAAQSFYSIILVRETNRASLQYIAKKGFVPKAIDCKVKTADLDGYNHQTGRRTLSAGLVVDPTLVGDNVFKKGAKRKKAHEEWVKFLNHSNRAQRDAKTFTRPKGKGFYAVDTFLESDRFGCLMVSEQDIPFSGFELSKQECQQWKQDYMCYIHGDYDLYALINPDDPNQLPVCNKVLDEKNIESLQKPLIADFVNSWIGAPMIQHGEQFFMGHIDDTLYAFYPHGGMFVLKNTSAQTIKDVFEVLLGVTGAY